MGLGVPTYINCSDSTATQKYSSAYVLVSMVLVFTLVVTHPPDLSQVWEFQTAGQVS